MDNNAFANPEFNEFINRQMEAWFARKAEESGNQANTTDIADLPLNSRKHLVQVENKVPNLSSVSPRTSSNTQSPSQSSQHPSSSRTKHSSYGNSVTQTPSSTHRSGEPSHPTPNIVSEDDFDPETPTQDKHKKKSATSRANRNNELAASSQSQPVQKPVPRTYDSEGKVIQPYKNRKDLAGWMRLKEGGEKDITAQVRERREFIKMLCLKRGFVLTQKLDAFDSTKMFQLIRNVTPEMQKFYGDFWDQQLVRDLIHAICIDKVRNDRALARRKTRETEAKSRVLSRSVGDVAERDKINNMEQSRVIKGRATESNTITDEEEQDEEINNNKGDHDADFYTAPPPRLKPIYPTIYQPVTPMHPRFTTNNVGEDIPSIDTLDLGVENSINTRQVSEYMLNTSDTNEMYTTTTESSPSSIISPLAGKGILPKKGIAQDELEKAHSRMSLRSESIVPVSDTDQNKETQGKHVRRTSIPEPIGKPAYIAIHIKGFPPMYIPANTNYEEFERRVAQRIEIPNDRFLLYRSAAAGAPKNKWVTVGTQNAWVKLVQTCGEEGAVVKVVGDSYFSEDAPDSDDDENGTLINPSILGIQKARKAGRPPGRSSQTQESNMHESQGQESQLLEPYQDIQVHDSQVTGSSEIAPARRRNNTGKGKNSSSKSIGKASKTQKKLSPNGSETGAAAISTTATITSSGRAIKRSMKAAQTLDDKAIKEAANQVTASRLVIKQKREDFAL